VTGSPERTLERVTDDLVRVAVAGSSPGQRGGAARRVRELAAEACALTAAETAAGYRKSLAAAWSAYLDLFLGNRELVRDIRYLEPELWQRLCAAVLGEDHE
jgi:hypothetical protein